MSKIVTGIAALALCAGVAAPATAMAAPRAASHTGSSVTAAVTSGADLRTTLLDLLPRTSFSPTLKAKLTTFTNTLPAGAQSPFTSPAGLAKAAGTDWQEIRNSAIDGSQYQCEDTALSGWLYDKLGALSDNDFSTLVLMNRLGGLDVPTYDALVFGTESTANTFGLDGSYTNQLTHEMRDLKRFWDIKSSDIQLMPMHGAASFKDTAHLAQVLTWMGYTDAQAAMLAPIMQELLAGAPGLQGGDFPYFTFNAFAYSNVDDPDPAAAGISDRIIVGDGILEGMKGIGLNKYAPAGILSHEFAHHVQYEDNLFDSPLTGPEATRRTELMADAFGTYFLVHKKGESNNKHAVLGDAQAFYQVGDCSFKSNGHHGTPNQRIKASTWGANMAEAAMPSSYVLPSMTLDAAFEKQLPIIVAPDAK